MKRFTSSIGITLLALLVSGWGNVLASALCPHAMGEHQQTIAEAQMSCHARTLTAEHQTSGSNPHAMDRMKTPSSPAAGAHSDASAFDQARASCAHCFGPKESSATLISAHGLILKKQDSGAVVVQPMISGFELTAGFTPHSIPTQHSPPGSSNRKHLLLGVFLI